MSSPSTNGSTPVATSEFANACFETDSPAKSLNGTEPTPQNSNSSKHHPEYHITPQKQPKRIDCVFIGVCIIVFIIGLGIGIAVGHFAISKPVVPDGNVAVAAKVASNTSTCQCDGGKTTPYPEDTDNTASCNKCHKRNPVETTGDGALRSLFATLTEEEIKNVTSFLKDNDYIAQIPRFERNRLLNMVLYPVNKTDALNHLDRNGPFPGRYALVTILRSSLTEPDVMDYKVGPLGSADMSAVKLRADGEISFNRRPTDMLEQGYLINVGRRHLQAIKRLLRESFDGAYLDNGLHMKFVLEPTTNLTDRVSEMLVFLGLPTGYVLHPLPVTGYVHHPGTDTSKWFLSELYYLSQGPFTSGEELQKAFDSGLINKIKLPVNYRRDHRRDYDLVQNLSLPQRPFDDLSPPVTEQPIGPRYTVKDNNVRFMNWQFDVTSHSQRGPAIFDVRFKGDRIAYEISLQDVTLNYGKQSNGGAPVALTDTHFFLGNYHRPRLGLDCPNGATILNVTIYAFTRTIVHEAMCLFEATGQRPQWRHGNKGLTENYLVLRAPMNLGNYDYSLEWQFHVDGTIQTVISASGYLYGAFFNPNDTLVNSEKSTTPFGFRISDYLLGPIHDHTFAFKVDIDVLGVENSFQTTHWRAGDPLTALQTQTNISEVPGYFRHNTRYLEQDILEKEDGFVVDPLHPKIWTVINEKERNYWGAIRGYRLVTTSTAAETFTDDYTMMNAWKHMKYHIMVTKRKENEQYGTGSPYDLTHPGHALGGAGHMLDSEPCRGSDLVLWVSEKFMHAPTAEDLPMTLQVHRGFTIKPFNYFDRTPTFDLKGHYTVEGPNYNDTCPT